MPLCLQHAYRQRYHSIRKGVPLKASKPVIAVKFINKEHAFHAGGLKPKQIELEVSLHARASGHRNVIKHLGHGTDPAWVWIAMEFAEGGDLFDKIEADEGVGEEIAHFYFKQLVSAVTWCHGKGVAHRDIKPENMLLSASGDLKLADFGLATQFLNPQSGERKMHAMVCGSPPYIAPEIIQTGEGNKKRRHGEDKYGYQADDADIWSCAIVLFVLLAGNTPWDVPDPTQSDEFYEFCKTEGRPHDELWSRIPTDAVSLLRGMLRVDPYARFALDDIRIHSWFTRTNTYMNKEGRVADSVTLATNMIERLHIDLHSPHAATAALDSQQRPDSAGPGSTVSQPPPAWADAFGASTQPETPAPLHAVFDWEAPPRNNALLSASQPTTAGDRDRAVITHDQVSSLLSQEPHMTQFSASHAVPISLTQQARLFKDILPQNSLARFYSAQPMSQVLGLLRAALHTLNVPVSPPSPHEEGASSATIQVRLFDGRKQELKGHVFVERINAEGLLEVRFTKAKGDPVEWRRLFKKCVVLARDVVVRPAE